MNSVHLQVGGLVAFTVIVLFVALKNNRTAPVNATHTNNGQTFSASSQLSRVIDGDTVEIMIDDLPVTVRLDGVDAPESSQPFGDDSKLFLARQLEGKTTTLHFVSNGKYGRKICVVFADGEDVGSMLVKNGLAWATSSEYHEEESEAKSTNARIWSSQDPIHPATWRKK